MNRMPAERADAGLQSVFKSVFPISDFRENSSLEFIDYSIGELGVQVQAPERSAASAATVPGVRRGA